MTDVRQDDQNGSGITDYRVLRVLDQVEPQGVQTYLILVVDVMWAWAPREVERRTTGVVELLATDTERRWLVRTFRWSGTAWGETLTDQIGCERLNHGDPAATVSGTAEDLDLFVWNRAERNITRSGSDEALGELQAMLDDGIQ